MTVGQIDSQALRLGLIDQVVVSQVAVTIMRDDRVTHLVYDVSR